MRDTDPVVIGPGPGPSAEQRAAIAELVRRYASWGYDRAKIRAKLLPGLAPDGLDEWASETFMAQLRRLVDVLIAGSESDMKGA